MRERPLPHHSQPAAGEPVPPHRSDAAHRDGPPAGLRALGTAELHQPELAGLCSYWAHDQDPVEVIRFWLDAADLRQTRAEAAYKRMRDIDPLAPLVAVLDGAAGAGRRRIANART